MKTSIVMATYNGEAYLHEQIKSLFRQSVLPDELIVADDASSDATIPILQSMSKVAPFPMRIIQRRATLGYAENFADAAFQSSSDVILFCDQDDYWEEEKIEVVKRWFEDNPSKSLAIHNIAICNEKLDVCVANYFDHLDKNYARHTFIKGCATAIRSDLAKAAFPLPKQSGWHHDNRVHAIARVQGSDGYINKTLIKHRIHARQVSAYITTHKGLPGRILALLEQLGAKSSPAWCRSLYFSPLLGTSTAVAEFLDASKKSELAPLFDASVSKIAQKELIISHSGTTYMRRSNFIKLSRLYLTGGYKDLGNFPQYIADTLRLFKN